MTKHEVQVRDLETEKSFMKEIEAEDRVANNLFYFFLGTLFGTFTFLLFIFITA